MIRARTNQCSPKLLKRQEEVSIKVVKSCLRSRNSLFEGFSSIEDDKNNEENTKVIELEKILRWPP
jgi:replicative superfamily II helicase